jgi:thiamine-phosphate pyrophosphorylase
MAEHPRLHAIVDVDVAHRAGWTALDLADAYANGGARVLQVRAKSLPGAAFLDLAARLTEIAHAAGAVLIVNDRADIARLSGADGVHLGQEDLSAAAARTLVGASAIVGLSTHTHRQIDAALVAPVSYVAVGPVFGTRTKATGYDPVGLELVHYAASMIAPRIELAAIGGITLKTAPDVIEAGATAVAVITDLLASGDPEGRVRAYLAALDEIGKV